MRFIYKSYMDMLWYVLNSISLIAATADPGLVLQVNHILYSNRSAAYIKLELFEKALADALKAKELDQSWPKVGRFYYYYFLFNVCFKSE